MFSITGQKKKQNNTEKGTKAHPAQLTSKKHTNINTKQTNGDNGVDGIFNKDRAITVVSFLFSVHFCQSQYCSLDLI